MFCIYLFHLTLTLSSMTTAPAIDDVIDASKRLCFCFLFCLPHPTPLLPTVRASTVPAAMSASCLRRGHVCVLFSPSAFHSWMERLSALVEATNHGWSVLSAAGGIPWEHAEIIVSACSVPRPSRGGSGGTRRRRRISSGRSCVTRGFEVSSSGARSRSAVTRWTSSATSTA
ncbi:MAG: hypothetical protein Greene041619_1231 [Candidatus Peregrinibacteria bacterium Greene0416_19]|nr:MAG: hypothetical protein Greene041619_1231 [Candidatus Peregrinibacteria bacterium Greene0416_19]